MSSSPCYILPGSVNTTHTHPPPSIYFLALSIQSSHGSSPVIYCFLCCPVDMEAWHSYNLENLYNLYIMSLYGQTLYIGSYIPDFNLSSKGCNIFIQSVIISLVHVIRLLHRQNHESIICTTLYGEQLSWEILFVYNE